jgi:hypothetical protein
MYTEMEQVCVIYVNSIVYKNTVQGSRKIFSQVFSDRNLIRKFVIVLGEVYFNLSTNVNTHSTRYWCSENPRDVYEVPLRNFIAGGWCVFSVHKIIRCTI